MTVFVPAAFNALFLPLVAALAGALLLPTRVPSLMRAHASRITIGSVLAVLLLSGALLRSPTASLSAGACALMALATLATLVIAAPLLDRGRTLGSIIAASAGGLGALAAAALAMDFNPALPVSALLPVTLLVALLVSFTGSALLPMSPLRHDSAGAARVVVASQGLLLAGWLALAVCILLLARFLNPALAWLPPLACAAAASLLSLLTARGETALGRAGVGLVAGLLIALPAGFALEAALVAAVAAALCVARGESISQAIRLDDPLGAMGALLLPLSSSMLMPALVEGSATALAAQFRLLGYALAAAISISVILWPLTLVLFGLALPAPQAREGVRR